MNGGVGSITQLTKRRRFLEGSASCNTRDAACRVIVRSWPRRDQWCHVVLTSRFGRAEMVLHASLLVYHSIVWWLGIILCVLLLGGTSVARTVAVCLLFKIFLVTPVMMPLLCCLARLHCGDVQLWSIPWLLVSRNAVLLVLVSVLTLQKMVFTFVTGRDPGVTLVQSTTQAAHTAARLRALQSGQDRLPYNHSPSACRWHDGRAHRPQFNENETKW